MIIAIFFLFSHESLSQESKHIRLAKDNFERINYSFFSPYLVSVFVAGLTMTILSAISLFSWVRSIVAYTLHPDAHMSIVIYRERPMIAPNTGCRYGANKTKLFTNKNISVTWATPLKSTSSYKIECCRRMDAPDLFLIDFKFYKQLFENTHLFPKKNTYLRDALIAARVGKAQRRTAASFPKWGSKHESDWVCRFLYTLSLVRSVKCVLH